MRGGGGGCFPCGKGEGERGASLLVFGKGEGGGRLGATRMPAVTSEG